MVQCHVPMATTIIQNAILPATPKLTSSIPVTPYENANAKNVAVIGQRYSLFVNLHYLYQKRLARSFLQKISFRIYLVPTRILRILIADFHVLGDLPTYLRVNKPIAFVGMTETAIIVNGTNL